MQQRGQRLAVYEFQGLQCSRVIQPLRDRQVPHRPPQRACQGVCLQFPITAVSARQRTIRHLHPPFPGDGRNRIRDLLRLHPAKLRPAEFLLTVCCGQLVSARRHDLAQQIIYVVAVRGEVPREPIDQIFVERLGIHVVGRFHNPAAHQLAPDPIHERPGEAAVFAHREKSGRSRFSFFERRVFRHAAQLRIEKLRGGHLAGGDVAACQFQLVLGEETGESVRILELPRADEAVVAGIAFEVHAEENLGAVLCGLHHRQLAGVDVAAPVDTDQEPFRAGLGFRIQQTGCELVIRQIIFECGQQPGCDGSAVADVRNALVVVQQIVPE